MNTTLTIKDLLHEAENKLTNSCNARLDAEVLLCNVMKFDRSKLYSSGENFVSDDTVSQYRSLVQERGQGRPVAYLTGTREFWSMEFQVNEHTLIPRPETECLVETVLKLVPDNANLDIADLGTGSGAIAIAVASERPRCKIIATDVCDLALAIAVKNAARLGTSNIQFVKSDWYANLQGSFDIIISNPPYIRNDDKHLRGDGVAHEPALALRGGVDGLDAIRKIISNAGRYLNEGGWLVIEHGFDQAQAVQSIMENYHFTDIKTERDYSDVDRVTMGMWN
jgi:release factor glutamine methyltransferase